MDNDPVCLQHKVYFGIAYFLGKRGAEDLRELKKDSFEIKVNRREEYLILKYNETTKKCQGDDYTMTNNRQIVLSQPNSPKCQVASFKFYLTKLAEIEPLFQQANPKFKHTTDQWYNHSPCGINTIGPFLKEISQNASLSYISTNHCTRGTMATVMKKQGIHSKRQRQHYSIKVSNH